MFNKDNLDTNTPNNLGTGVKGWSLEASFGSHIWACFYIFKAKFRWTWATTEGRKCCNRAIGYQRGGHGSGRGFPLFAEKILTSVCHLWESVSSTENTVVGKVHNGSCSHIAYDLAGQTDVKQ